MAALVCTSTSSCSMMTDDDLTRAQAQAVGTLGGAAVGAGLGIALRSSASDAKTKVLLITGGAVIGGVAGLLVGSCWGESIVRDKAMYKSDEEYALANLEQMENRVSDARRTNNTLRKEVASAQRAGKIQGERLAIIKNNVKTRKDTINKEIRVAKKSMKGAATAETNAKLREEIKQLEEQAREISANVDRLQQYT